MPTGPLRTVPHLVMAARSGARPGGALGLFGARGWADRRVRFRRAVALPLLFEWTGCESQSGRDLASPSLVDLWFGFEEFDQSESARREPSDVRAERSVVVPVAAEVLDPPRLFIEVAAHLAVSADLVVDGLLQEERRVQDRRHQDAARPDREPQLGEVGEVHQDHLRDDDVVLGHVFVAKVDVLERDLWMELAGDLEKCVAPVDADDIGAFGVQLGGVPAVAAAEVENALAGNITDVTVEEFVEPVDLALFYVRGCGAVPSDEIIGTVTAHVPSVIKSSSSGVATSKPGGSAIHARSTASRPATVMRNVCESCRATARDDAPLEVGHILSLEDGIALGVSEAMLNSQENLILECRECRSLSGRWSPRARDPPSPTASAFAIRWHAAVTSAMNSSSVMAGSSQPAIDGTSQ